MSKVPKEEKTLLKVHICNTDLEVVAPVNEEQNYLEAAEYLNQKIDTFAKVYASQKPLITIILLVALEFAHDSLKQQHSCGLKRIMKIFNWNNRRQRI